LVDFFFFFSLSACKQQKQRFSLTARKSKLICVYWETDFLFLYVC